MGYEITWLCLKIVDKPTVNANRILMGGQHKIFTLASGVMGFFPVLNCCPTNHDQIEHRTSERRAA